MDHIFCQTSRTCSIKLNLLLSFLCSLLINWTPTFFMHNKYVLIFLLTFDLVSFFPLCLKRSVADTSKFSVLRKEKMYKTKTTEWHNELKPTENELKMKICLLTLYLNHFNENMFMFERTLKKLFWFFYFFCGIVKLICELRHTFFINLRLGQMLILRPSALFLKNLRSVARKFAYSAVCDNTYAPRNNCHT